MSMLRFIYLILAVAGAVLPLYYTGLWIGENGFDLPLMVQAWHANNASSALVWDLFVAAIALTVWILAETYIRKNWMALIAIPATFLIGVSFGLPLYLYFRSRPIP